MELNGFRFPYPHTQAWHDIVWHGMAGKNRGNKHLLHPLVFLCIRAYLRTESGEARLGESVNCECDVMWSGESVVW